MKSTFNISGSNPANAGWNLYFFAGENNLTIARLNKENNTFYGIQVFSKLNYSVQDLEALLVQENFGSLNPQSVYFIWTVADAMLIPLEYFNLENAKLMMDLVYGDLGQHILVHERAKKMDAEVVSLVSKGKREMLYQYFPKALECHQNGLIIDFFAEDENLLFANFNENDFTAFLKKNGNVQIIQKFESKTAEDAAYHLLNLCQRFDVDATKTSLFTNGSIDKNFNLYNELYKYFETIEFIALPAVFNYTNEIKDFPEHYFSHFFSLASCV